MTDFELATNQTACLQAELPKWLYIGLPVLMLVLPFVLNSYFPALADIYFEKESGIVENLTVMFLVVALVYVVICWFKFDPGAEGSQLLFLRAWLVLYTLGCVYYLGEEISWGQHLFDWATPDAWVEINDQQETNLHNTFGVFDQLPRILVTLGIVIGGVGFPAYFWLTGARLLPSNAKYWIVPSAITFPVALTVLIISLHDKPYGLFGLPVPSFSSFNDGEAKEALIALFIMIYAMSFYYRGKGSLFAAASSAKK